MMRVCPDMDALCPNGIECNKPCATGRWGVETAEAKAAPDNPHERLAQYVKGVSPYRAWRGEAPEGEPTLKRDIEAMLAAAPKTEPVWSETYIADEEDGPISGVLIDMLDGVQIWTGEASKALVDAAIAIDESPDQSGIYLMTGCPQQGTRIMASLARVEDGTEIARALAMKWSEASHPEAPKVEQEPKTLALWAYFHLTNYSNSAPPERVESIRKVRDAVFEALNSAPANDAIRQHEGAK